MTDNLNEERVKWEFNDVTETLTISGNGAMYDFTDYKEIPWNHCKNKIKNIIIENGVTSIGNNAFFGCDSLTNIVIPEGVMSIGDYAFSECSSLTNIVIPKNVVSVENLAFCGCDSLEDLTINNPDCEICNNEGTIPKATTIYGHKNSSAEEYAKQNNRKFVEIRGK